MNNDFLNEELRGEYLVTRDIKRLWALQIKMLLIIDEICKKHDIKYFGSDGTMLGAVRHKGFIPWDDDIDLGMTRDNYEKFLKVAPNELSADYFLQTTKSEPGHFFSPHAQLRYNNSTLLLRYDYKKEKNKGVFVDIFVFDKIPNDIATKGLRASLERDRKMLSLNMTIINDGNNVIKNIIKKAISSIYLLFKGGFKRVALNYDSCCMKYNALKDNYSYDNIAYNTTRECIVPKSLEETIRVPFEFIELPIPVCYDKYLTAYYTKNYMTPLKAPNDHGQIYFDLDKPYKEYEGLSIKEYKELFK